MNFQDLIKVENADWYIDLAFRTANRSVDEKRHQIKGEKIEKSRRLEMMKLAETKSVLIGHFNKILTRFPSLDNLPIFYQELVRCTIDFRELKRSLGSVKWVVDKIELFFKIYSRKIRSTQDISAINGYRKEFYGRLCSVIKQINKFLKFLEASRKIMKEFPSIKTDIPTVAIFGFPNVGKTTLLYKLTGSKPDIQPYAFTTKELNIGYIKKEYTKIQVIDTPGTLNRFEKMNSIEKQAYLAVKYCANAVIYVFDLTEPYPLDEQIKLYERLKSELASGDGTVNVNVKDVSGNESGKSETSNDAKKLLVYISKSDLVEKKLMDDFVKSKSLKSAYFDPKNLMKHLNLKPIKPIEPVKPVENSEF